MGVYYGMHIHSESLITIHENEEKKWKPTKLCNTVAYSGGCDNFVSCGAYELLMWYYHL